MLKPTIKADYSLSDLNVRDNRDGRKNIGESAFSEFLPYIQTALPNVKMTRAQNTAPTRSETRNSQNARPDIDPELDRRPAPARNFSAEHSVNEENYRNAHRQSYNSSPDNKTADNSTNRSENRPLNAETKNTTADSAPKNNAEVSGKYAADTRQKAEMNTERKITEQKTAEISAGENSTAKSSNTTSTAASTAPKNDSESKLSTRLQTMMKDFSSKQTAAKPDLDPYRDTSPAGKMNNVETAPQNEARIPKASGTTQNTGDTAAQKEIRTESRNSNEIRSEQSRTNMTRIPHQPAVSESKAEKLNRLTTIRSDHGKFNHKRNNARSADQKQNDGSVRSELGPRSTAGITAKKELSTLEKLSSKFTAKMHMDHSDKGDETKAGTRSAGNDRNNAAQTLKNTVSARNAAENAAAPDKTGSRDTAEKQLKPQNTAEFTTPNNSENPEKSTAAKNENKANAQVQRPVQAPETPAESSKNTMSKQNGSEDGRSRQESTKTPFRTAAPETNTPHNTPKDSHVAFGKSFNGFVSENAPLPRTEVTARIMKVLQQFQHSGASRTTFKVDGGSFGKLDISFSKHEDNTRILILVNDENARSQINRMLPELRQSLSDQGLDFSSIETALNENKGSDDQQQNLNRNGLPKLSKSELEELLDFSDLPEKAAGRNFGYNTMEITI